MQTELSPNTRLINERLSHNWKQCDVAAFVGTTRLNVNRWERGKTFPGQYFRRRLCEVFGKTAQKLGLAATSGWAAIHDPAIPLLRPTPTHLVGRTALLNTLKERLTGGVSHLLYLALSGLPGVGKTTLALALAHTLQVREHFADGMLWVGLGPKPDVLGQLSRWGTLLGIAAPQEKATRKGQEAWSLALRKALWERRMLLVIDDAWRIEDALAFRVGGPQCSYLLTTRFVDMATQFAWDGATKVDELDEEDGMTLLATLAPAAVEHDPQAARALEQGPVIRKRPCSRKLDKCGSVWPFEVSDRPRYRRSWIIGGVFEGIQESTAPIIPHRSGKTRPIILLISTCTERKERRQRQRERTPSLTIRLRQGTKPYHEHYVRTRGGVRRILRLR